jgi:hypothetical protein
MENTENQQHDLPEGLGDMLKNNLSPERLEALNADLAKINGENVADQPKVEVTTPVTETTPEEIITTTEEAPKVTPKTGLEDSLFFSNVVIEPTEKVEIKDLSGFVELLKGDEVFGVKDEKDIPALMTNYKSLVEKTNQFEEKEQQLTALQSVFTSIPDYMYEAIDKFIKCEDFEDVLRRAVSTKVDFTKPFEKQNEKDIIEHYFPGDFSEDEYEDDDDKALKLAKKQAKEKFENDRKNYKPYRTVTQEKSDANVKALKDSANIAISTLSSQVKLNDNYKTNITKTLNGGFESIASEFFNQDGTWKPDAAEKIMFMKYGKTEIEKVKQFIKNRTESSVTEQFVTRGNDRPTKVGNALPLDANQMEKDAIAYARKATGKE